MASVKLLAFLGFALLKTLLFPNLPAYDIFVLQYDLWVFRHGSSGYELQFIITLEM